MVSEQKRQYILGGIITAAVVIFIISVFTLMSRTNLKDISMDPNEEMGWSYELISGSEARPAAPVPVDSFTVSFPGESCRAVRATRTIKEELNGAQIGIYLYDAVCGVDILLDDEMIYTSFEGANRDGAGFAVTDGAKPSVPGTVECALPEDYIGHKLTVVTYFPSETSEIVPLFPYLCSVDTAFSVTSVENVLPISFTTVCAILAFLTALAYVLDISNGRADKRALLLTLFYTMLTIDQAFSSLAGSYSLLAEKLSALDFFRELYIAPLLIFAALRLTSWRRWTLAAATGTWFVFDSIKLIRSRMLYGPFYGKSTSLVILLLYLLALVLIIFEMKVKKEKHPRKSDLIYAAIAVTAAAGRIIVFSAEWDWDIGMYIKQLVVNPLQGYFYPLVSFISYVGAITATISVFVGLVKRTLKTREMINALEAQNRRAMERYKRMAEAEAITYSVRHEIRHHMLALSGMLESGDTDRAREYTAALTAEYEKLPEGQYSKNPMINMLAGAYLERAKARGAEIKYSLNLPETLPIADTDLCVFVTNMFENAVNACEKLGTSEKPYIYVKMYINGNYLFIGCDNSSPREAADTGKNNMHGYGLENMRRIAKKYGGIVKIDRTPSSFSVKSGFYLKNDGKSS